MSSDSNFTPHPGPGGPGRADRGLPPVTPPSGRMFVRLFGVPALIVVSVVGGLGLFAWAVNRLAGETRTAEQFLRDLDNPNPEVRWRAASDLAQVLPRDERLASDPSFALHLADRLVQAVDTSAPLEKAAAARLDRLSYREGLAERS